MNKTKPAHNKKSKTTTKMHRAPMKKKNKSSSMTDKENSEEEDVDLDQEIPEPLDKIIEREQIPRKTDTEGAESTDQAP